LGAILLSVFLLLVFGVASFAPMDAAVYAGGTVSVAGSRVQVHHREGGVVTDVLIREGDHVDKGQVLMNLTGGAAVAKLGALRAEFVVAKIQESRLIAEALSETAFKDSPDLEKYLVTHSELIEQTNRVQRQAMTARWKSTEAQVAVLQQQRNQTEELIKGGVLELSANEERIHYADSELSSIDKLAAKGIVAQTQIFRLKQNISSLAANAASTEANLSKNKAYLSEIDARKAALYSNAAQDVINDLREVQNKLSTIVPQLLETEVEADRLVVRAPAAGRILGLAVFNSGAVVGPGQKILEIVPDNVPLIIDANIDIKDGDDIRVGMDVEIKYSALHERTMPKMKGEILEISADSFSDQKSGSSYYKAQIELSPKSIEEIESLRGAKNVIKPGLPVELIIPLRKRTALEYLIEPLSASIWRGFREH
jgi:HlyD family secretion protein